MTIEPERLDEIRDESRIAQFIWFFIRLFSKPCEKCKPHRYGYTKSKVDRLQNSVCRSYKECRRCGHQQDSFMYVEY